MRISRTPLILPLLLAAAVAKPALADKPVHSVTGSGLVVLDFFDPDLVFRTAVSVAEYADGTVRGSIVARADLDTFGLGEMTVVYDVDCLHVDGNSAWARGVVTHSTNPDVFFIGETDMLMVHDLGGPGEDIMHIEFVPEEITCSDEVELFPSVIEHGNFQVK